MFKLDVFIFTLYFGFLFIYLSSSNNKILDKNINFKNINKIHTDINGIKYTFVEDKSFLDGPAAFLA